MQHRLTDEEKEVIDGILEFPEAYGDLKNEHEVRSAMFHLFASKDVERKEKMKKILDQQMEEAQKEEDRKIVSKIQDQLKSLNREVSERLGIIKLAQTRDDDMLCITARYHEDWDNDRWRCRGETVLWRSRNPFAYKRVMENIEQAKDKNGKHLFT